MKRSLAVLLVLPAFALVLSTAYAQTSANSPATSPFRVVPTPDGHVFPLQNPLYGVSASSKSDIWAVGQTAIHFNGEAWSAFSLPNINGDNTSRMGGVVDFAPNNVWAVGLTGISEGDSNQIIEHFDGTSWSVATGPTFGANDEPSLESITAISSSDMWATGFILTDNFTQWPVVSGQWSVVSLRPRFYCH